MLFIHLVAQGPFFCHDAAVASGPRSREMLRGKQASLRIHEAQAKVLEVVGLASCVGVVRMDA